MLGRDSFKGMGVDFGDLNGDGWLDIFVSNIAAESYSLEESHFVFLSTGEIDVMQHGIAPYVDQSEPLGLSRSGWGWDARLADFDNDGVPEALQAIGFVRGDDRPLARASRAGHGQRRAPQRPAELAAVRPGDDLSGHQRNPFFVRDGDGRYYDLSADLGLDEPG